MLCWHVGVFTFCSVWNSALNYFASLWWDSIPLLPPPTHTHTYHNECVCVLIWCLNKWFFPWGRGGSWQYITVETMGLPLSLSPGTSRLPTHARPSGICGPAVGPSKSMLSGTRARTGGFCAHSILCSSALLPFSCLTTPSPFSSADFSPPDDRQSL